MEPIRQRSLPRLGCGILITISLGGCALGLSGPDPARARYEEPKCDTGKGAVMIDGVWVAVASVAALVGFAADESGVGLSSLAIGGAFLGSAIRGNNEVNDCRAAFVDYRIATAVPPEPDRETAMPGIRPRPIRERPFANPRATPVPAVATPPPPAPTPPQPTGAPAPEQPVAKPAAPAAAPASDDEWSSFWKEVP